MDNVQNTTNDIQELNVGLVSTHLSFDQIQNIANNVMEHDVWAEREIIKTKMMILYLTDLTEEKIDEIGLDSLMSGGIMAKLSSEVDNLHQVDEAIKYQESLGYLGQKFLKVLTDLGEFAKDGKLIYALQELIKNGNSVK